jgi:hypothetical protein
MASNTCYRSKVDGRIEVMGNAEELSGYWMTVRKRENTIYRKRKH